jgi:hypothetical protein
VLVSPRRPYLTEAWTEHAGPLVLHYARQQVNREGPAKSQVLLHTLPR